MCRNAAATRLKSTPAPIAIHARIAVMIGADCAEMQCAVRKSPATTKGQHLMRINNTPTVSIFLFLRHHTNWAL